MASMSPVMTGIAVARLRLAAISSMSAASLYPVLKLSHRHAVAILHRNASVILGQLLISPVLSERHW